MFESVRARLKRLEDAPRRARELAAARLTARCRTGHVEPAQDGLRVSVKVAKPFVSEAWAAEIDGAIKQALREGA